MDVRTVMTTKIMTQTNIRAGEMRSPRIFVFHNFFILRKQDLFVKYLTAVSNRAIIYRNKANYQSFHPSPTGKAKAEFSMEEIIKSITEAEAQAEALKAQALARAAEIAELAEERAAEIEKKSAKECKEFRENALKTAQAQAQQAYDRAIEEKRGEAKTYVEQHLERCNLQVQEIVRRVLSGNC